MLPVDVVRYVGTQRHPVITLVSSVLLTVLAIGFAAFGLYALARARYPDRDPSS